MPNNPHPVVLYARVSQARDERSKSVDDQLAALRGWAQRENWPIVAEYRDDGISASRYANGKHRPGWEQTMAVITSGRVRALLVWELSRATRDKKVSAALESACAARGIRIGYHGRLHDPATADGEFGLGLESLLAAREAAVCSERTLRAVASRAARGAPHGTVPYGYRRVIHEDGRITRDLNPNTAPIVAEIISRLLDREPAEAIARDLNIRGVPTATGIRWRGRGLSTLAQRPTYAGLRVHNGVVLPEVTGTWPPIISLDDHYRIRALYASPERDRWRNPVVLKNLGTGLYRCGRPDCEGRMRVVAQAGKPNRYGCRVCHRVGRLQKPVDAFVEAVIVARLSRPDALEVLYGSDDNERHHAAAEVTRLRAEEADMLRLLREGQLSPVDQAAWRKGWAPRIKAAESAARPPQFPTALDSMIGPDAASLWAQAPIAARRAVLDALVVVTILPTGSRGGRPVDLDSIKIEWRS